MKKYTIVGFLIVDDKSTAASLYPLLWRSRPEYNDLVIPRLVKLGCLGYSVNAKWSKCLFQQLTCGQYGGCQDTLTLATAPISPLRDMEGFDV